MHREITITNTHNAKLFSILIVLVMALCAIGISLFGNSLGPPVGDLTRIGGLSEKNYGFRREGIGFTDNHFTVLRYDDLMSGKGKGQILTFGDSFSTPKDHNITWQNTLYEKSGLTIDFVEIETLKEIRKFFQSDTFRKAPPKAIILEMGERTIFRRALPNMEQVNCAMPPKQPALTLSPQTVPRIRWKQRTDFASFDERLSWGALALRFRLLKPGKTVDVALSRSDLFSSSRSDRLLIYQSDIIRHTERAFLPMEPEVAAKKTLCAMHDVINAANGLSPVYLLIAPDKRSVYTPWIQTGLPPKAINFLEVFSKQAGSYYIDVFSPLSAAVHAGKKDVYFPNDTHWSAEGHAIVGSVIAETLGR
ncbi:hypothetical protein [Sneathiella sp.]|jgi:hypothetical protein|uniref:hypothetical protein n=1 Tax=Sneathiella sp. TaxID=1964365 RepID=UPI0039E4A72F